jgi:hypothetical protein
MDKIERYQGLGFSLSPANAATRVIAAPPLALTRERTESGA